MADMFTNPYYQKTTSSPGGKFPELWGIYDSINAGKMAEGITGAMANEAAYAVSKQKEAEAEAEKQAELRLKVRKEQSPDGGWNFFDGLGQKITVEDYARAKGTTKVEALSGSYNPDDMDFINDFKETVKMKEAIDSGDIKYVRKYKQQLIKAGIDPASLYPEDIIRALQEKYQKYWLKSSDYEKLQKNQQKNQG